MASGFRLTIGGVKAVQRKLRQLEPKVAKKAVKSALCAALKPTLAKVRSTQPSDTGETRRKTKIYTSRTRKKLARLRVVVPGRQAAATEWGTEWGKPKGRGLARRLGLKGRGKGHEPQRFLKRAFDSDKDNIKDTIIREITQGIEREWKG